MTAPTGISSGRGRPGHQVGQDQEDGPPEHARPGRAGDGPAPTTRRRMCGVIRPTKPIRPDTETAAAASSAPVPSMSRLNRSTSSPSWRRPLLPERGQVQVAHAQDRGREADRDQGRGRLEGPPAAIPHPAQQPEVDRTDLLAREGHHQGDRRRDHARRPRCPARSRVATCIGGPDPRQPVHHERGEHGADERRHRHPQPAERAHRRRQDHRRWPPAPRPRRRR